VDEGGDFLSVTASGFKGEGHETVAKVIEVILLPLSTSIVEHVRLAYRSSVFSRDRGTIRIQ